MKWQAKKKPFQTLLSQRGKAGEMLHRTLIGLTAPLSSSPPPLSLLLLLLLSFNITCTSTKELRAQLYPLHRYL